jgi:hypothetical protein
MTLKQIASLIPREYRKEILELNMIDRAIAQSTDPTMHYLGIIWKNYVDPNFTGDCNLCYGTVLTNLKNMKTTLVEMERESKLLDQV